jgi:hypothetical protein
MQYPFSDLVAIPDVQRMLETFASGSGITGLLGELEDATNSIATEEQAPSHIEFLV